MSMSFSQQQLEQITAIVAGAFTHQVANTLASQGTTPTPIINIARPREFTGSDDYLDFRHKILLFVSANPSRYPLLASKIYLTLSYLKGGNASMWMQNYVKEFTKNSIVNLMETLTKFQQHLDTSFDDLNHKAKALVKICTLTQKDLMADEFFQKFNILRMKAGMMDTAHDFDICIQLQQALRLEVVQGVL